MEKICVVTDSTSDLNPALAASHGIRIVPLSVIHNGKVYLDGVDITPDEFYPLLKQGPALPTTSQPTILQFIEVFKELTSAGMQVISTHISAGLSSTAETARSAAQQVDPTRIHVVDSGFLSYGLGFQALRAAVMAREGRSVASILDALAGMRSATEMLFSLDTLYYLQKGGRIGRVASLLGNLLNIKPVIKVENGVYIPLSRARSLKLAATAMAQHMADVFKGRRVMVAAGQGQAKEMCDFLAAQLKSMLNVEGEVIRYEVGPVLGVHTGPGCIGVAVYPVA